MFETPWTQLAFIDFTAVLSSDNGLKCCQGEVWYIVVLHALSRARAIAMSAFSPSESSFDEWLTATLL